MTEIECISCKTVLQIPQPLKITKVDKSHFSIGCSMFLINSMCIDSKNSVFVSHKILEAFCLKCFQQLKFFEKIRDIYKEIVIPVISPSKSRAQVLKSQETEKLKEDLKSFIKSNQELKSTLNLYQALITQKTLDDYKSLTKIQSFIITLGQEEGINLKKPEDSRDILNSALQKEMNLYCAKLLKNVNDELEHMKKGLVKIAEMKAQHLSEINKDLENKIRNIFTAEQRKKYAEFYDTSKEEAVKSIERLENLKSLIYQFLKANEKPPSSQENQKVEYQNLDDENDIEILT